MNQQKEFLIYSLTHSPIHFRYFHYLRMLRRMKNSYMNNLIFDLIIL